MTSALVMLTVEEFKELLQQTIKELVPASLPSPKEQKKLEFYTREELAAKYRISLPTLDKYVEIAKLPKHYISHRLFRFRSDEIDVLTFPFEHLIRKRKSKAA